MPVQGLASPKSRINETARIPESKDPGRELKFEEILLAFVWCRWAIHSPCCQIITGKRAHSVNKKSSISTDPGWAEANFSEADEQADKAPYLNFNDDKVKFNTNNADNPNENYGSVSCWLPPKFLLKEEGA